MSDPIPHPGDAGPSRSRQYAASNKFFGALISLLTTLPSLASADILTTTAGQRLDGPAKFTPAGVVIANQTIPLASLFSLTTTASATPVTPLLHLSSGSAFPIKLAQTLSPDYTATRIQLPDGSWAELPTSRIAGLTLRPNAPLPSEPGALFPNGDVFPGKLRTLDESFAMVDSTLFGSRKLDLTELSSLLFQAITPTPTPYIVRLRDGSVSACHDLVIGENAIAFADDTPRSPRTVSVADVVSITRGPSYAATVPDQTLTLAPMNITLPPNTAAVLATVQISPHLMPLAKARIVVLADNVETFRSPPLSSLDDPIALSIPATGKAKLTLKLEPTLSLAAQAQLKNIQLLPQR